MTVVVVTGSSGLIGSESVRRFCEEGYKVVGIDNDMRKDFFGPEASTFQTCQQLSVDYPNNFLHHEIDIRDRDAIGRIFELYGTDIEAIIHTAAQPSHDWAANDPFTDFSVNATGTLVLLEATRRFCPTSVFIFTSTNKVYGDTPNRLPLVETETRWEIEGSHAFRNGIDESMSIDNTMHSLFGVSKVSADILVQEYGRYFGMKTAVFRAGCLTGQNHAGTRLHGFLSYLVRCVITGTEYSIYGYKGKQVRDNLHSRDLVHAFVYFFREPSSAAVFNIGGGREANCSLLEAITKAEAICGKKLNYRLEDQPRQGDHQWWISDTTKFKNLYPAWGVTITIDDIIEAIFTENVSKWV